MKITLQPIKVSVGETGDGRLVVADGWLVAVLVQLGANNGVDAGGWFVETGYGAMSGETHPVFSSLATAKDWFTAHLTQ